jgi:hypothetical protein
LVLPLIKLTVIKLTVIKLTVIKLTADKDFSGDSKHHCISNPSRYHLNISAKVILAAQANRLI